MKKLLVLGAIAGGAFLFLKRSKASKAEAALWKEATAPSTNGSAKKA